MAAFRHMVSMARSPEEKAEDRARNEYPRPVSDMPDVPMGLCICLTETELSKLGIDPEKIDCSVGDTCHIFALAKVTSVSKRDTGNGPECRLEMSLTDMAIEDEDEEEAEDAA